MISMIGMRVQAQAYISMLWKRTCYICILNRNQDGSTALHLAAYYGHSVVRLSLLHVSCIVMQWLVYAISAACSQHTSFCSRFFSKDTFFNLTLLCAAVGMVCNVHRHVESLWQGARALMPSTMRVTHLHAKQSSWAGTVKKWLWTANPPHTAVLLWCVFNYALRAPLVSYHVDLMLIRPEHVQNMT